MYNNNKRIISINPYFTIGIILVMGFGVLYFSIYKPAIKRQKKQLNEEFKQDMLIQAFILDNSIEKTIEAARSMSSRTMIRKAIQRYYQGQITFQELKIYTEPKYIDGIKALDNCLHSARYVNNKLLIEYSSNNFPLPGKFKRDAAEKQLLVHIHETDTTIIVGVDSPIIGNKQLMGFDIVHMHYQKAIKKLLSSNIHFSHTVVGNLGKSEKAPKNLISQKDSVHFFVPSSVYPPFKFKYSISSEELYKKLTKVKMQQLGILMLLVSLLLFFLLFLHQQDRIHYFKKGKHLEKVVRRRTWELQKALKKREETNQILIEKENLLRKSNQTKDKFFSILGHDLMGPITSIIGLLNLIQRKKMSEEKKSRYIHTVSNELKEIEKLLENLLLWSRSQRGLIRFEPGQCQMREASQEAISIYQSHINTKQIEVVDLIDKNMTVYADENMLKTIMRNLISNAIKFTPSKGHIEIGAISKPESTYDEIWVKDSGIGMKPETANQLFSSESITSTKGTDNEKGSGLGLTLCKEFVDKHKGNIWAISTINQGSTFTFTIPHSPQ